MHYRTIVVSDIHLGTPDTKHQAVLDFLKSNTCDNLILNWDIIDGRFLSYFPTRPPEQRNVIEYILKLWAENKVKITYLQWNHERFWQNILPITINNILFTKEIIYQSGDKKYLICHWQQFDKKMIYGIETISFWAGMFLFRLNRRFNNRRISHGYRYISIVSKIKRLAKKIALWWEDWFKKDIIKKLKEKNYDWLICGHLHKPEIKFIGHYHYLNSGDRIESLTALVETEDNEWKLIKYK